MSTLDEFVRDEAPCLDQLRTFVGGEAGPALDTTLDTLHILDAFVSNLNRTGAWDDAELCRLFSDHAGIQDLRPWLTVRVAYYIGACARKSYAAGWYLSQGDPPVKGTPVVAVDGIEFSPLEVAAALLDDNVAGGLVGFFADLEVERRRRKSRN